MHPATATPPTTISAGFSRMSRALVAALSAYRRAALTTRDATRANDRGGPDRRASAVCSHTSMPCAPASMRGGTTTRAPRETPGAARRRGTTSPATSEVEAYSRADHPKRLRARGEAPFLSSASTTSSWPNCAAHIIAVLPFRSGVSTSGASASERSASTRARSPHRAARCSGGERRDVPLPNMSGVGTVSDSSSSSARTDHARTDLRAAGAHMRAPRDARCARAIDETDAHARHPVDVRMVTPKKRETWHADVSVSRNRDRSSLGTAHLQDYSSSHHAGKKCEPKLPNSPSNPTTRMARLARREDARINLVCVSIVTLVLHLIDYRWYRRKNRGSTLGGATVSKPTTKM